MQIDHLNEFKYLVRSIKLHLTVSLIGFNSALHCLSQMWRSGIMRRRMAISVLYVVGGNRSA